MITTRFATLDDVEAIRGVAEETWPISYANIITPEQIRYMLDHMYAPEKIATSIQAADECFILAEEGSKVVGFAGIAFHQPEEKFTRLNKLYVLPAHHGKRIGKTLLDIVEQEALQHATSAIHLNVNKYNPAFHFYTSNGYTILEEMVLDIGNGFVMDDYILIKPL